MKSMFPAAGAAVLGFAVGGLCFSALALRPASAQFRGTPTQGQPTQSLGGIQGLNIGTPPQGPPPPQPIEIQALDADHFVVATREPRLVVELGKEGVAQNMLVTVVTHYTVRGDRLIPVEHVRVPARHRAVSLDSAE
jgi:hypothetical protein